MSVALPGVNEMIMRTGFVGKSWAKAGPVQTASAATRVLTIEFFMVGSSSGVAILPAATRVARAQPCADRRLLYSRPLPRRRMR